MSRTLADRPTWNGKTAATRPEIAQRHVTIRAVERIPLSPTGWSVAPATTGDYAGGGYAGLISAAVDAWAEYELGVLMAGTWEHKFYGATDVNKGIIGIKVNGTQIGTFDQYSSSYVQLASVKTNSFVLASTMRVTLRYTVIGKNASATDYHFHPVLMTLDRTGA